MSISVLSCSTLFLTSSSAKVKTAAERAEKSSLEVEQKSQEDADLLNEWGARIDARRDELNAEAQRIEDRRLQLLNWNQRRLRFGAGLTMRMIIFP
jgi:cyclopropane fatty-acyl-phospholipid synthase-like methyltransferase